MDIHECRVRGSTSARDLLVRLGCWSTEEARQGDFACASLGSDGAARHEQTQPGTIPNASLSAREFHTMTSAPPPSLSVFAGDARAMVRANSVSALFSDGVQRGGHPVRSRLLAPSEDMDVGTPPGSPHRVRPQGAAVGPRSPLRGNSKTCVLPNIAEERGRDSAVGEPAANSRPVALPMWGASADGGDADFGGTPPKQRALSPATLSSPQKRAFGGEGSARGTSRFHAELTPSGDRVVAVSRSLSCLAGLDESGASPTRWSEFQCGQPPAKVSCGASVRYTRVQTDATVDGVDNDGTGPRDGSGGVLCDDPAIRGPK
ncbi:unnamed protein product [Pedinophyceae sp. YPF-701]|nr:unnamed protein product [Pedinophyceae sp. YPF-701]